MLVMLGTATLGDDTGKSTIIVLIRKIILIDEGESLDPAGALAREQRNDARGIDTPREVGAKRHIGLHLQADAVFQQQPNLSGCLGFVDVCNALECRTPPAVANDLAAAADGKFAAAELLDVAKRTQRRGNILQRQIVMQGDRVRLTRNLRMREQRLRLGAERNAIAQARDV